MRKVLVVALALGGALACQSGVPHPAVSKRPPTPNVEVLFPAPPARVELVPPEPKKGAVWVNGEWLWQGRHWAWKNGAWVVPPEGASLVPWTLSRGPEGKLLFSPGSWRDAEGNEIAAPAPLLVAKSRSGVVFNAAGEPEFTGEDIPLDAGP